jgi:hypothetical protein
MRWVSRARWWGVADTDGPCELCGSTESPRWYRASPPLCGAAAMCQVCHGRAREALVRLNIAARRCPVAVIEALAERLEIGAAALPPPEHAVTVAPPV